MRTSEMNDLVNSVDRANLGHSAWIRCYSSEHGFARQDSGQLPAARLRFATLEAT